MLSDIDNARKLMLLLGDEGFTEALTQAEELVEDANDTLDRVERIEDEAADAVREANETLLAVDRRLDKVDRTIHLLEAKIEAGFSLGFLVFAANAYVSGDLFFAAGLAFMGLLGAGQLAVTITNIPQVEKLLAGVRFLLERAGVELPGGGSDEDAGETGRRPAHDRRRDR
jgi:hypothetical protein